MADWGYRDCGFCGKSFKADHRIGNRQAFCSDKCRWDDRNQKKSRELAEQQAALKVGRLCLYCGNALPPERRMGSKYCGYECSYKYRHRKLREAADKKQKEKGCLDCGKWIGDRPYQAKYCIECSEKRTAADKARSRSRNLKSLYGLSLNDVDSILKEQGGGCAICGATEPGGSGKQWHVDHDHDTMVIRGILCAKCNRGLGHFNDDTERMRVAIKYVEKPANWGKALEQPEGETHCLVCGKSLAHRRRSAKYCSRECLWKTHNKGRDKLRAERSAKIKATRKCKGCGGPIPEEKKASAKWCSGKCYREASNARRRQRRANGSTE